MTGFRPAPTIWILNAYCSACYRGSYTHSGYHDLLLNGHHVLLLNGYRACYSMVWWSLSACVVVPQWLRARRSMDT